MRLHFRDKHARELYKTGKSSRYPQDIIPRILMKLDSMASAEVLDDLRSPPSNHLESLRGDLKGYFSIRVNNQYRIIFKATDEAFLDIVIYDYH